MSGNVGGAAGAVRRVLGQWWRRFGRGTVAAVVALTALALVGLGPAWLVVAWRDHSDQQQRARLAHQVGEPVRDGPITFIVHEVRCGLHDESTHGRLCEVTVGARNDGDERVRVPGSAQTLHVSEGARHQPSTTGSGRFGRLEPQEAATVVIRYDLPLTATITHLELRAGTYARGVPVALDDPYPLLPRD